jgi:putative transcriptional regulator
VKKADLNKKIGQRIIALREKKGLSQSDLARACSKDRQAIEKLENGRVNPTLYTLYEVAKALEIPLSAITDIKI